MTDEDRELEEAIRKARIARRTGMTAIGIVTLCLIIPMLIGAIGGAMRGELWDPYTGERWSDRSATEAACFDGARRLVVDAAELDKLTRKWDEPARAWKVKCRENHPELYQLIAETRADLVKRGKKKR